MKKLNSILMVDDDHINNFINSKLIKRLKVCENLFHFSNGTDAMRFLEDYSINQKDCPDLILLDLKMPVMDGYDFIEFFKKTPFRNKEKVQIIPLTTSVNLKDSQKIEALGIKEFLIKPLKEDSLNKILEKHPALIKH
jgi:CheY-like chemotaxis protein